MTFLAAYALKALEVLWKVLLFTVSIPLWLILVVGIWWHFDKSSAVRTAVDRAITDLVNGAELEAEKAKSRSLELILAEQRGRAAALESANKRFSESLEQARVDLESANDQIKELAARPVNRDCTVDDDVLNRLRSR